MKNYQNIINIQKEIESTIYKLLSFLEQQNFQGWEPYDIPEIKFKNFMLPNLFRVFLTQLFRLSPISLHPYFLEKKLQAKAACLFARAFLILFELTNNEKYYDHAIFFLNWIKEHSSLQTRNFSIGTQYQLSMKNYNAPPGTPAPLITCFAIEAFISAYEIFKDNNYLELAESGVHYFSEELPQIKISYNQAYFIYHPKNSRFIPNVPALISGTLSRFYSIKKNQKLLTIIKNNLNYVVSFQREDGSWFYQPGSKYTDSFHTAFILEALAKYQHYVGDNSFEAHLLQGISFYEKNFFKPGTRPVHKKVYGFPNNADSLLTSIDVRDIAMGLVLFSFLIQNKNYSPNPAIDLLNWSCNNFQSEHGYFYYQKIPIFAIKGPYLSMQAWVLFALCTIQKTFALIEPNKLFAKYEKKKIELF